MKNGFQVIDCDRHVVEPPDIWERYLDKRLQHYNVKMAPVSLNTSIGGLPNRGGGGGAPVVGSSNQQGFAREPIWRGKYKGAYVRGFSNDSYLFDMDKEGVDIAVCFTGMGLITTWRDDMPAELSDGICRGYNNWLYDYMSINPERLKGVCLIPLQDLDLAEKELERASKELGMRGIFWRPNPHMGRLFSHPDLDRIYARCEELDVTVCSHEGSATFLSRFSDGRTETGFANHMVCHPFEQMGAFMTMAASGVFDRFPRLRAAYLESGAGWLPYWVERLDAMYENPILRESYRGKERPSEYWRRGNAFTSCEADEKTNAMLGRIVGEDCLMWASDYPHTDAMMSWPNGLNDLTTPEESGIPREFIKKILFDNPKRFFGLKVEDKTQAAAGVA